MTLQTPLQITEIVHFATTFKEVLLLTNSLTVLAFKPKLFEKQDVCLVLIINQ